MNVKIELPIHNESIEYLNLLELDKYKELNKLPQNIKGRCVIHIYPYEDTNDGSDCGKGFIDAFNCELHIYDEDNKSVFKTKGHDEINVRVPCKVRIFKDLSTMLIIDTPVKFFNGQLFEVYKSE